MMRPKLIIIEGIPGSGKSTTAQFVNTLLRQRGISSHLHNEGSTSHPTALDGLAYLELEQLEDFLASQASHKELLQHCVIQKHGGFLFNYRAMQSGEDGKLPDDLLAALYRYDIYETLSAQKIMQIALERWQTFAITASVGDVVYIFECCFLQDPLTIFLGQHNCAIAKVTDHILAIRNTVAQLNPLLIFLQVDSVRKILEQAVATRPQAWIDFVTEYITGQGYGKAHGLAGFDGVVKYYELLKLEQEKIIPQMSWPTISTDVSEGKWHKVHRRVAEFLQDQI